MNSLLYYPGFEVENKTWLKFAVLYLDELRPIIPYMSYDENYFSEDAQRVMGDTNLIRPYRPKYDESVCASVLACEEFVHYLDNPEIYYPLLNGRFNIYNKSEQVWKNKENHTYTLFQHKFSYPFSDFCIKEGIATQCDEGIMLPEELAFTYMSFLADIISKNNEIEMFTDINKYNSLLMKNDKIMSQKSKYILKTAQKNIELHIPKGLKYIPLKDIIKLRNESRKAYMKAIEKFVAGEKNNGNIYSFDEVLSYQKDFLKLCGKSFDMSVSTTLLATSIISINIGVTAITASAAIAASLNELRSIQSVSGEMRDFITDLKQKHLARKYVVKINRLNKR